jgi:hypothetical protein
MARVVAFRRAYRLQLFMLEIATPSSFKVFW